MLPLLGRHYRTIAIETAGFGSSDDAVRDLGDDARPLALAGRCGAVRPAVAFTRNMIPGMKRAGIFRAANSKGFGGGALPLAEALRIHSGMPGSHYQPIGWIHWPEHPDHSMQFLRVLGSAQDGGSAVSECFLTALRIVPGDDESWQQEWCRIADATSERGDLARSEGSTCTARSNWLRASNYYRAAAIFLEPGDRRRRVLLERMRKCSQRYLECLAPMGEIVSIPYSEGRCVQAYFVRAPCASSLTPVVICIGGPGDFKDEHLHRSLRHAHARGLSVLLVDLPGQDAEPGQNLIRSRNDIEVSLSCCVDYLADRSDVDDRRIAIFGDGIGASFASLAACSDDRFSAAVCDAGIWDLHERAYQLNWMLGGAGADSLKAATEKLRSSSMARRISCPVLVAIGEHDALDAGHVAGVCHSYKEDGLDVTLKIFSAGETAASSGHIDNPTMAIEFILDWISARLKSDGQSRNE